MIYAIGAFDGFHIGHQRLLHYAALQASKCGDKWGVITFVSNPQFLFRADSFKSIFLSAEKDLTARYLGIDNILKIQFSDALSNLDPSEFLSFLESEKANATGFVVGENFRFGKDRVGTPEFLRQYCSARGYYFKMVKSVKRNNVTVSSTLIRTIIETGDLTSVEKLLGYPYFIRGKVVRGDMRGRTLGFPTANIAASHEKIYPSNGSYVGITPINGKWYPAAVSIGSNPTFAGKREVRTETHIIGFSGDIYGRTISVLLLKKNRDEIKFDSVEKLTAQLRKDISVSEKIAARYLKKKTLTVDRLLDVGFDIV